MINWAHWHNEPYLVGGLVLLGWLYAMALGPLREWLGAPPVPAPSEHARRVRFFSSLVIFYLAVGSPLDQIGEQFLFSAHMLQHLLLVYPAAALMLLGIPDWLADRLVGAGGRLAALRLLCMPPVALVFYNLVTGVWHVPALYDLALQDKAVHVLEHVTFFGAALVLWMPVLSPARRLPPLAPGGQILYWLGMMILATPLFAYITFSRDILYPTYEYAPRISWLTAKEDQVLAGSGMKLVGIMMAVGMSGIAFWRWHQAEERGAS